jgi:hypothetical protein
MVNVMSVVLIGFYYLWNLVLLERVKPYIEMVVGLVNIYNKTILVMGVEELLIMRIENDLRALRLKLNHRIQLLKLLNLDL